MMKSKWLLGMSLCVLGACGLAVAQDPPATQPPPPPAQEAPPPAQEGVRGEGQVQGDVSASHDRPMTYHRVKNVMGAKVHIQNDLAIGTVEDIVFSDDGRIEYMVVANEGKLVSVPWDAAKFNFERRSAVVAISEEKFRQIPTFTAENYPRFADPQWRTTTYSAYGVPVRAMTPRQERKMDRIDRKMDRKLDRRP